ncbi:hypothetical protein VKT23_011063 [Stygiomarasmius scandens]|uniref:Cytochrome P450 n=1 Tax=Marasmiellus scandens TaxID=2682957 RepID=A0ABR1JFE7_9AGAR
MIRIFPLFVAVLIVYTFFRRSRRPRLPLPPGPKGLPILGDAFSAINSPKADSVRPRWAYYLDLSRKYRSDIVHINILGDHTVVLNSVKAINELLEKRSALYSDRPAMHMFKDLVG